MKSLKIYDAQDFPSYLPKLNALYDDLFAHGKGFRSKLIQKLSGHLELSPRQVHLLSQTIEFIHNASLLHDDLVDRSHLRRHKTAAWLKYTPEYAVLAGDYLLARVMVNLSRYGNLKLLQYTAEMISDLLEGEWIQDSLVEDWDVEMMQLDQVHKLKTASLFKWCIRAPFLCQEIYEESIHNILNNLGGLIGLLFQRCDDLLDFDVRNYEDKAVLGDLKSGYLNSFAAFIVKDLSSEQKKAFISCQTKKDIENVLGQDHFNACIKRFDELNQQYIDLYLHNLHQLESFLTESQKGLVHELEKLPKLLYWRQKSS